MAQQYASPPRGTNPLSPAQQIAYTGGPTASIYGPSLSRTRPSDERDIAMARAEYDARLAELDAARDEANRIRLAEEWDRNARLNGPGVHGGHPRTAFYNTREGGELIAAARSDLSARAKPVDRDTHRNTVQDNRQRVYHGECVLPQDLAVGVPQDRPVFQQFPLAEYNRWNMAARTWSGPDTHTRLKSVPYSPPGPSKMDVPRRHDLVKNLKKNKSISNYDHGLPFVAKHTNNLVSC